MTRLEAIQLIVLHLTHELVIHANGMICRESFAAQDRPENFYMIGSMGLASSIALGIALCRPDRKVVVFDGDGNLLMNLGGLAMIGALQPRNLIHIVFDNEAYGSTGGQASLSKDLPLQEIARASGYRQAWRVEDREPLVTTTKELLRSEGPSFLLVKVSLREEQGVPRISYPPAVIRDRVMAALQGTGVGG